MLHPEKYFAGEAPVAVKPAKALPSLKKWKLVYSNVMGELGMSSWLRTRGVPEGRAANQPFSVATLSPPIDAPLPGAVVSREIGRAHV